MPLKVGPFELGTLFEGEGLHAGVYGSIYGPMMVVQDTRP